MFNNQREDDRNELRGIESPFVLGMNSDMTGAVNLIRHEPGYQFKHVR